ncbi:hypothetical protein UlMin_010865 [Ulmus minor]
MEYEQEGLKVLDSSLSHLKWRLKASARRRLETDILALCTEMRPVIMVDYGGKMPELQQRLCALLKLCQKESSFFEHLRIMIIEDMIYLVHVRGLAEHVHSSLNSELPLLFVNLEEDPPKMITQAEKSPVAIQLLSIQKLFSSLFPLGGGMENDLVSCHRINYTGGAKFPVDNLTNPQSSEFIDLSSCMQDTQVTIPTLNGWILGYPIVYLFSKEHISEAIHNLSTKPLHLFKISVCRNSTPSKGSQEEELLSFSVPYDLSMLGSNEEWSRVYLTHMQTKWQKCKHVWSSLRMDVSEYPPQAIVL